MSLTKVIQGLKNGADLTDGELGALLETDSCDAELAAAADSVRRRVYGDRVYIRGLIEFTNYCKNNCFYCGIRRDNKNAERYRLTKEEILDCCREGYSLGFRTFVLQGGEDPAFTDDLICEIVSAIRSEFPTCAITLSIGEKSRESYLAYYNAGANRYLLRHETADGEHYARLHPASMSLERRKECLFALKEIGYQTGSGFMVGSPGQTTETLIKDFRFLQSLQPDMIGVGPYIRHSDTPFAGAENGDLRLTLRILSILRLLFPYVLLPATTALATLNPQGRELGLRAGANVVMPNLSPMRVRKLYSLYENKSCTGEEAAQSVKRLTESVRAAGYSVVTDRGDVCEH